MRRVENDNTNYIIQFACVSANACTVTGVSLFVENIFRGNRLIARKRGGWSDVKVFKKTLQHLPLPNGKAALNI